MSAAFPQSDCAAIEALLHATVPGGYEIAINMMPLANVAQMWSIDDTRTRTIFPA
jgi:hypothetical protein